jgi:phosphatidylserine/phosphatidylglycerophosphate/cardiolipin synthase-like enzyme
MTHETNNTGGLFSGLVSTQHGDIGPKRAGELKTDAWSGRWYWMGTGVVVVLTLIMAAFPAHAARKTLIEKAVLAVENSHSYTLPATGSIEVAFSPNEGSENLVVKVIDAAKSEIRLLAYSFTSAPVVEALLRAKHRGVNVAAVVDYESNVAEGRGGRDKGGKSRAAMSALANAGIDIRTIDKYPIHHDKTVVIDRDTVELGSFNYSAAAANRNSENVLVNWHNPQLAKVYLGHFDRNYRQSVAYKPGY